MSRSVSIDINVRTGQSSQRVKGLTGDVRTLDRQSQDSEKKTSAAFNDIGGAAKVALGNVAANAITGMVTGLKNMAQEAIRTGAEYEQQMADLSAITGIAGNDLDWLGRKARENAIETGSSAQDQIEAYKLLASNIDIAAAGGVRALEGMGAQVVTLSQAAGIDLATASDTVAASINQWGLEASETSRVVNVLAAGSKFGAAEVGDLSQTLKNAGTAAASANIPIEETVGATEVLSQNALKGAEAGTQLRNIITILRTESEKLAEAGLGNVNLEADGLTGTLQKLQPLLKDNAAMAQVFGRENLNAAQILIQNTDSVEGMTEAVTGTDTAIEQAMTQMDTFQGVMKVLGAVTEDLQIAFFNAFDTEMKAAIRAAIDVVQEFKDDLFAFFRFVVTNGKASFETLQEVADLVFENLGQIIVNFTRGLPRLIAIGIETAAKNFQSFVSFVMKRIASIGDQLKALGDILIGAFTADPQRVERGLDGVKNVFAEAAEDVVQLGKEMGENYGNAVKDSAEVLFADIDTSALQQTLDQFISVQGSYGTGPSAPEQTDTGGLLPTPQQPEGDEAGTPGTGSGGSGDGDTEEPPEVQRMETMQELMQLDKDRTDQELELSEERREKMQEEVEAGMEAAKEKEKAFEREEKAQQAVVDARERALTQQIATADTSVQTAQDAANAVVRSVRQTIQAKLAELVARALAPLGPAALVAGPAVAAGVNLLFNNVLPQFAEGEVGIRGGIIHGPGGPTDDMVMAVAPSGQLIRVSAGESIVNAASTQAAARTLHAINESPQTAAQIEHMVHSGGMHGFKKGTINLEGSLPEAPSFDGSGVNGRLDQLISTIEDQTDRLEQVERRISIRDVDEAKGGLDEHKRALGIETGYRWE